MNENFYLSNMVPQNGSINSGKWRSLEGKVQKFVLKKGQIWVITGPIFDDIDSDGDIDPSEEIGAGKVWKPASMYKIVITADDTGETRALAFIMPNKKPPTSAEMSTTAYLKSILTTIDDIEARTGLDFMYLLSDNIENDLEASKVSDTILNEFLN